MYVRLALRTPRHRCAVRSENPSIFSPEFDRVGDAGSCTFMMGGTPVSTTTRPEMLFADDERGSINERETWLEGCYEKW